jgi:hypothetical protein
MHVDPPEAPDLLAALFAAKPTARRRATLLHMSGGSIIRYWGGGPSETVSFRPGRTAEKKPETDPRDEPMTRDRRSE